MSKKTAASKLMDMFFQEGDYDPRYAMRKLDPIEGKPVVEQRPVIEEIPLTLEQLEGRPYLTTMSDRTAAGGLLTGFGDKQLGYPVNLTGGQDFMRDFTQNPNLWASGDTVVPKMVKAARELEAEFGQPPVLMPWRMAPTGSDFAGMTGKTMLSYAAGNMPTTFKREVDGFMKLYVPDWKGVDNPASGAQFDALPDGARKQVQQQLDKLFRNKGGTTLPQSRLAIADQSQLTAPVGGFKNVGLIDTSQDALRGAGNPTYPSALAGDYLGTLDTNVTAMDLNPARYARARNPDGSFVEGPEGKDLLSTKTAPRRSMEVNYYGGLLDDKLLRDLEDRGFNVGKKQGGFANIGLLPALAAAGYTALNLFSPEEADAAIVPSALRSIALDAMADVPRKKPTSYTGWKKALNKAGIKDDELKQMGFKREFEFRQRSQDITRKEVEDFLAENQYNIREETLRKRKVFGEVVHDPELNTYNAVMPDRRDDEIFHTRQFAEDYVARNPITVNDAPHGAYTLTGGDDVNYREILLMDGPEADKYEAITKKIANVEEQLKDVLGAGPDVVDYGDFSKFNRAQNAQREQLLDELGGLKEQLDLLPQPFIKSSHYDEKENILSHLRVADRDLEDGSSTLMVEEIQSDLHQHGQEVGYSNPRELKNIQDQIAELRTDSYALSDIALKNWAEVNMPEDYAKFYTEGGMPYDERIEAYNRLNVAFEKDFKQRTGKDINDERERMRDLRRSLQSKQLDMLSAAPDMPFKSDDKSSWYDLAFKRSLMEAADGDYDSISFTTGQQQVDRYGESAKGGVKTFYDKTLPNHINKWAKQYGVKLERKPIRVGEKDYSVDTYDDGSYYVRNEEGGIIEDFDSLEEAEAYIKEHHEIQDVYTLKIPEKMRKDIREKGMPLFAQTGLTIGGATAASGLLSPKAQANEARMQGLLSDSKMRQEVVKGAAVVPDLTAGLVEQFGRDLVNFTAGTINPDYGDIAEGSIFPVTEGGKATLSKAGEAFMKYAAPTLAKGVNSLLDFEPMIGPTARDQMKFVAQQYEKLPESVKEEVTPRLGYAGLLALTAVPTGVAVKKSIQKRKKSKQQ